MAGGLHGRGMCVAGGYACQGGMHGKGGACVAGETATAADGMHSCVLLFFLKLKTLSISANNTQFIQISLKII